MSGIATRVSAGSPGTAPEAGWPPGIGDGAADGSLLRLARLALEAATVRRTPPPGTIPTDIPDVLLGAFVTLTIDGELRGCMGHLDFERPLVENLVAAATAVTRDPRFRPLEARELPAVRVEVSVISEPVPIPGPEGFDASRHGIVVEHGRRRALLLPQVARERGWDARRTLRAVCEKAGLDRDDWQQPDTQLSVFLAHEAIEPEVAAPG